MHRIKASQVPADIYHTILDQSLKTYGTAL